MAKFSKRNHRKRSRRNGGVDQLDSARPLKRTKMGESSAGASNIKPGKNRTNEIVSSRYNEKTTSGAKPFGEDVAATNAIRSILGSYPFSIGLLREIIANSDDAKASQQIFVLDRRTHGNTTVHHPYLAATQGPAFLAYNDKTFRDEDWGALRRIHDSSKTSDTSTIGKYGVGFRASYHVTDTPHILSGPHLVILDPLHDFTESGGVQLNIEIQHGKYEDHLATFHSLFPSSDWGKPLQGTIFRLPLRTAPSRISDEIVSPEKISELLKDFVREELSIALLFLRNLTSIEVYEISDSGKRTRLAAATIDRASSEPHGSYGLRRVVIQTNVSGSLEEREWCIFHALFSRDEAIDALKERVNCESKDLTTILTVHKLSPDVDLAIPLDCSNTTKIGRLFAFQPLPLDTGFPIHINSLFALTSSRQNLRNAGEKGIVRGSGDDLFIEWNRLLFDTYIPTAWAAFLNALVQLDYAHNIFEAWPSLQAQSRSGENVYWKDVPSHIAKYAISNPIWPILGMDSDSYGTITSLLVDKDLTEVTLLDTLGRAGLQITQPPPYITQILCENYSDSIKLLSPEVVHEKLQALIPGLSRLSDADASIVLEYLASASGCRYIANLPLVPTVSGARVALPSSEIVHQLFSSTEEELFRIYDPTAISLRRIPSKVRKKLLKNGGQALNATRPDSSKIASYLASSPYRSQIQETATEEQVHWLDLFWSLTPKLKSISNLDQFYLVPTTSGSQRPSDIVIDPESDDVLVGILKLLNVPVIDERLSVESRRALRNLKPSSDIHSLLRSLPRMIGVNLSEDEAKYLGAFMIKHLQTSCLSDGPLDSELRTRLRALPIFPLLTPSPDTASSHLDSIDDEVQIHGVEPSIIPILPRIHSAVYLDLHRMSADILKYLGQEHQSPLSIEEMHKMMLNHFESQSLEMQVAFVKHLGARSSTISRGAFDQLANIAFVRTCDGSLRPPKQLIDPQAAIAALYPGASCSLPDTSQPLLQTLVTCLRDLKLFVIDLAMEVVRERMCYIASGTCPRPEELARRLIILINTSRLDCHNIFDAPNVSSNVEWIPTPEGLKSPLGCRDVKSHRGKHGLFDNVMPMVCSDISISDNLRCAFPWDGEVSFEVLSQQLVRVLDEPRQSYGKVREIVKEIGNRDLTTAQLSSLRELLTPRAWVPVRGRKLLTVVYALLGETEIPEIGFCSIAYDTYSHAKVRNFLKEMGCVECPSEESILQHLQLLHESAPLTAGQTAAVIRFLAWLPSVAPEERTRLFIPDTHGTLRPFDSICYNDIGPRSSLVDIGNNYLAHSSISDELAVTLGLRRLGFLGLESQFDDDIDMGEDLITTIRNRLREYSDSQLLLEFIANASDAGASEFNILLDQKASPAKALISPRCSAFQSVPALVIHNDSVFEESDFKGILRTGIGGKSDKLDTIGQFGLGALTMFHVTEFAMIVSGDHVLFLNPCKAHLAVGRASLRLPLSQVRKLYSDHLKPLDGVFGFKLPRNARDSYRYNGTLFRLPLRSEAQFLDSEPISRSIIPLQDLVSGFRKVACDCLLFTTISSIRCSERKIEQSTIWTISASRSEPTEIEEKVTAHTVTISTGERDCKWRVLSMAVKDEQLPPSLPSLQEKYRLRVPPIVRIAASPSPASQHNLFSTLPLPISLELPVHISGSFILASDRRSIRLDEYENVEASYNRWLLQTIVPILYSHLLADKANSGDNSPYWPGGPINSKGAQNAISKMVTDAVYQNVATSTAYIFDSKYHDFILTPGGAYLIGNKHHGVLSKILDDIQPSNIVEPPSFAARRLKDVPGSLISLVTPEYMHKHILDNPTMFKASNLELDQLQELIGFLCENGNAKCLVGLPLLFLEDGSFAEFDISTDTCFYVASRRLAEKGLFNQCRIIHRDLDVKKLLEIEHINIAPISDANIGTLLDDYVSPNATLKNANEMTQQWLQKFWKAFKLIGVHLDAIADYPLIPTLQDRYVSLNHCRTSPVIVADLSEHELQAECLTQMGFTLVDCASLPKDVRYLLPALELSVENVLEKLFNCPKDVLTMFSLIQPDSQTPWIDWVREGLRTSLKIHPHYSSLPLWKNLKGSFISAHEVVMLPRGIPIMPVSPFVPSSTVVYDGLLKSMGTSPSSILSILNKPTHLEDDEAYRTLLIVLVDRIRDESSIPVPNSQRLIKESSTLYSSRDELFLAAFGTDSENFILPSFRDFEPKLEKYGLQTQRRLSIATFKTCLHAFQKAKGNDLNDRAATIFRIFSKDLPLHVDSNSEDEWEKLEDFCFILRLNPPQPLPGVEDVSRYIAHQVRYLPDIVSLNQLVREEFQPIAWSQRAVYLTEPNSRVLMLHPSLSVPSATEVVNHLVVLATDVARDHPQNGGLIDHLKQTYKWLDENAIDAEDSLKKCTRDRMPLFLNVDDPTNVQEAWEWKPANHILLDDYDTGFLQCPRDFIKPFQSLLVAAGAVSIDYGLETSSEASTEEEEELSLSERFNQMRSDGTCTDVRFTFDCNEEPLYAHRAYLAAYSNHFKDMFSGFGIEAHVASAAKPITIHIARFSRRSMGYLLDYLYTSEEPDLKREQSDLALEILVLAHKWLMTAIQDTMQDIMIQRKMVDPFNLDHVRATAADTMSEELLQHCAKYEKLNFGLVQQAREHSQNAQI